MCLPRTKRTSPPKASNRLFNRNDVPSLHGRVNSTSLEESHAYAAVVLFSFFSPSIAPFPTFSAPSPNTTSTVVATYPFSSNQSPHRELSFGHAGQHIAKHGRRLIVLNANHAGIRPVF